MAGNFAMFCALFGDDNHEFIEVSRLFVQYPKVAVYICLSEGSLL